MNEAKFTNLNEFKEILQSQPIANSDIKDRAFERNGQLTKPPGALGRLEELSIWFSSWHGNEVPTITSPQVVVFAGNHGVTTQGVSAFPQEVTAQMVLNFEYGGAAINQLCKTFDAKLDVVALDLDSPTNDFTCEAAMSEAECIDALKKVGMQLMKILIYLLRVKWALGILLQQLRLQMLCMVEMRQIGLVVALV